MKWVGFPPKLEKTLFLKMEPIRVVQSQLFARPSGDCRLQPTARSTCD
jgi:hypothetical protein